MFKYASDVNKYLLAFQQGDRTYVHDLFELTANHLKGVARLYLINKSFDDDAISIAFAKVLAYIHSYDPTQDGYNWLCKIVQNVAYTINECERKMQEGEMRFAQERMTNSYDAAFDEAEFFMDIEKLNDTDQFIAHQRFYLDQPMETIGDDLNISKVAVFQRIKNFCKKLK